MKVKLEDVIEALDSVGPEMEFYYSTKTEEILMVFDGMVNGDDNKELIKRNRRGLDRRLHTIARSIPNS